MSKAVAVPCVPVLVSDLLLHLGVRQGFQERAPLVSVARVANRDLHRGQRVLAAGQGTGNKATPSVGTQLPWVTSPGTTQPHLHCLRLQHCLSALFSTVWVPEVHHRLLVTPWWSLKFLGKQLHPSPATTGEGFVLDLQFFPTQAVTSLAGRVQPQKAQLLLPAQPRSWDCSQDSLSSLAVLQLSLIAVICLAHP